MAFSFDEVSTAEPLSRGDVVETTEDVSRVAPTDMISPNTFKVVGDEELLNEYKEMPISKKFGFDDAEPTDYDTNKQPIEPIAPIAIGSADNASTAITSEAVPNPTSFMSPEEEKRYKIVQRIDAMGESQALEGGQIEDWFLGGALGEAAFKGLGKLGSKLWDAYQYKGLPDNVVTALKTGDEATLNRLLNEGNLAEKLGIGDLLYTGKRPDASSLTSNLIEQRKFNSAMDNIGVKSLDTYKKDIGTGSDVSELGGTIVKPLKEKADALKKEMSVAYKGMEEGLSDERLYNVDNLKREIRDMLIKEGAQPSEVSNIIQTMEPSVRRLTTEMREQQRLLNRLKGRALKLESELAGGAGQKAGTKSRQLRALKNKITKLEQEVDKPSPYISERDIVNIIKGFNRMATSPSSTSFANTANAERLIRKSKGVFEKEIGNLLKLNQSPILDKFQEANKKAAQYYNFRQEVPEIDKLLSSKEGLNTENIGGLLQRPGALQDIINKVGDKEYGKQVAEAYVKKALGDPTERMAGSLEKLNYSKVADRLNNLLDNTNSRSLIQKNLPIEKVEALKAYQTVANQIAPLEKSLEEVPTLKEYILKGDGVSGVLGRAIKATYDTAGYLKNQLVEGIPVLEGMSSRVKVTSDKIDKVRRIADRVLKEGRKLKLPPEEIGRLLTLQEEQYLQDASDSLSNIMKGAGSKLNDSYLDSRFGPPKMMPTEKSASGQVDSALNGAKINKKVFGGK